MVSSQADRFQPTISCSSRVIRGVAARSIIPSASIRSSNSPPLLDRFHAVVGKPEMMADLVDQHMAHDMTERLPVLGPIVEDRPPVEEDHRLMSRSRDAFVSREVGT